MMYSGGGSSCDSGQMAMGQTMMYQPGPSPTANWLETAQQSEHKRRQIQQQKQDDGQPVAVRVITSDSGAPSERSDNYVPPPFARGQQPQQPASPSSHLDLLYERAQQPVQSPSSVMPATTSPHADGVYRSLGRAVPAPVHHHNHHHQQQQQALSTAAARTSTETDEYNALSRATPAPIQQHAAAAAAERMPTSFPAGAVDTAGTSSHCTTSIQHNNSLPPTAQVYRQLSQLTVGDGQQQPAGSHGRTTNSGSVPAGSQRTGRTGRQLPPAAAFTRRMSAPGPTGQTVEPGSRKPWSYTPSFGVGPGPARVNPVSARSIMQPTSQNGMYTPRVRPAEGLQSNGAASDYDVSPRVNGDAIDSASIRYKLREGEDPIADYDETSIRYRGRTNPSKTFRLLQSATGSDSESESITAYATARRRARRKLPRELMRNDQLQQPPRHADDIVDISYVGASIPSRTFRILQQAVGDTTPTHDEGGAQSYDQPGGDGPSLGSGRNVRVVHLRPTMKKHCSVDNILSQCTDL